MSSDGTRNTTSPGTRRGSRLVARSVSRGPERSSVSASPAVAGSRCSQLSRISRRDRCRTYSTTTSMTRCPDRARRSSAAAIASATSPASVTPASSTRTTPSGWDGSTARANSRASRVLPTPPVPARVSSLVSRSNDLSSVSSRPRPMKELASAGSDGGRSAPAAGRASRSAASSAASSASSSRRPSAQSS